MGKKSKIFYYSILIVNVVFFLLDLTPIRFEFFRISFAVTLLLIGIMLAIRAFTLKIDSSLFFGVVLFCCGILNLVVYFAKGLDINQLWPYYLFAVALGSIITAIYFKDKLQLKIFILFLGFGIITLLFVQHLIKLWLMIVLLVVWFVAYFVVNLILYNKRRK